MVIGIEESKHSMIHKLITWIKDHYKPQSSKSKNTGWWFVYKKKFYGPVVPGEIPKDLYAMVSVAIKKVKKKDSAETTINNSSDYHSTCLSWSGILTKRS